MESEYRHETEAPKETSEQTPPATPTLSTRGQMNMSAPLPPEPSETTPPEPVASEQPPSVPETKPPAAVVTDEQSAPPVSPPPPSAPETPIPSVTEKQTPPVQALETQERPKENPLPRPDNPETEEISGSKESGPGRDDGLSAITNAPVDDPTAAGRRRIQESLKPTDDSSQPTDPSGDIQTSSPTSLSANDTLPPVSLSIPNYSPSEEVKQPSDWKNLGIINVPVADLPEPDSVNSPDDFNHHISWENAKSATLQLPQIQQEVTSGKTGDDFYNEDQAAGLDWQHGRKRVYDLYYSNTDPIQVDKDGEKYTINSGRHRIYAAKALGLKSVPALVREKHSLPNPQEIPNSSVPISPSLPTVETLDSSDKFTPSSGVSVSPSSAAQLSDNFSDTDLNDLNRIKASEFSPEIKTSLEQEGLNNYQDVLDDNTPKKGEKAEQLTRIVIAQQGLPNGSGGYTQFQNIIPGQYNNQGNGIDLVGITPNGKPVPIEVKKRSDSQRDTIEAGTVKNLNEETQTLLENIQLERQNNPVLAKKLAERKLNEPDPEISPDQMSDLWLRDRWISLIKNKRDMLQQAGITSEYLDLDELVQRPYSDVWKQILDSKHTVIVSSNKDNVSNTLLRQATLRKGFDVSVIDLGS